MHEKVVLFKGYKVPRVNLGLIKFDIILTKAPVSLNLIQRGVCVDV